MKYRHGELKKRHHGKRGWMKGTCLYSPTGWAWHREWCCDVEDKKLIGTCTCIPCKAPKGRKMKTSEIKVGKTYCNRGKGLTMRRVIDIYVSVGMTPCVKYMAMDATGNQLTTYSDSCPLSSFAKWAGKEVEI